MFCVNPPVSFDINISDNLIELSWEKEYNKHYKVYSSENSGFGYEEVTVSGEFQETNENIYWYAPVSNEKQFFYVTASDIYWTRTDTMQSCVEYKLFHYQHHFLTIIDENGTFNIRPHPGNDENGWGSSWYAQPFLPGADLRHSIIESIFADSSGIRIEASGNISYANNLTYGDWSSEYVFTYNHEQKKVTGLGNYSITLDDSLTSATGDLNLCKIASNYLMNVPLLDYPFFGDTGDMDSVYIEADNSYFPIIWTPTSGNHFPGYYCDSLSIDVSGNYNNVDTGAQGFEPIAPAYKPSLKVTLVAQQSNLPMIFGAIYNSAESDSFHCDNVGITPLILNSSNEIQFDFGVHFESIAIEGD